MLEQISTDQDEETLWLKGNSDRTRGVDRDRKANYFDRDWVDVLLCG